MFVFSLSVLLLDEGCVVYARTNSLNSKVLVVMLFGLSRRGRDIVTRTSPSTGALNAIHFRAVRCGREQELLTNRGHLIGWLLYCIRTFLLLPDAKETKENFKMRPGSRTDLQASFLLWMKLRYRMGILEHRTHNKRDANAWVAPL